MPIPRKVQEAADKAEATYKQVYESPSVDNTDQETTPEPETAPEIIQQQEQEEQPAQPIEVRQEEPRPEPPKPDPWEHKFKVIEGKYKAEVPRLAAQIREHNQKIADLSSQNEELKVVATQPAQSLISPEDREKYGDDLLDVIKRAATEATATKDVEIDKLKKQLESISSTTAEQRQVTFYDRLAGLVPDWVTVNDNENFHQWLDEYDELTGKRRQDLLSAAEDAQDADRVARFFNKWKQETESSKATSQQTLAAQVAPDSNKAVKPPAGKRYFSRGDIADFYSRARRGEFSQKEMVALEAEIHAATVEGRIR